MTTMGTKITIQDAKMTPRKLTQSAEINPPEAKAHPKPFRKGKTKPGENNRRKTKEEERER